jgi:hypothetical protein
MGSPGIGMHHLRKSPEIQRLIRLYIRVVQSSHLLATYHVI